MSFPKFFKKKKTAEKKAKKAKKKLYVLSIFCAFCLGAFATAFLVYQNKEKLAVMTVGKRNINRRRLAFLRKKA